MQLAGTQPAAYFLPHDPHPSLSGGTPPCRLPMFSTTVLRAFIHCPRVLAVLLGLLDPPLPNLLSFNLTPFLFDSVFNSNLIIFFFSFTSRAGLEPLRTLDVLFKQDRRTSKG